MLTVADAFAGTAALASAGRGNLAQALGCGRADVATAPLGDTHDRAHRRRLRAAVVAATAPAEVQARLAPMTLGDLGPGSKFMTDGDVGPHQCRVRLHNLLARQQALRWSTLLALRVGDALEWSGAGTDAVSELIGLVFERSMSGLASVEAEPPAAGAAVDLALLLDGEDENDPAHQLLLAALNQLAGADQPLLVRDAATRLLRTAPKSARHVDTLTSLLASAGDARDIDVFVHRTLLLGRQQMHDDLGKKIGLSGERTRQLRLRAEARVRAAASAAPTEFRQLVPAVAAWLGGAVPGATADEITRRIGAGSSRAPIGALLLWLAGPYRPVRGRDGWLAVDRAGLVARTNEWLAEDGGARPAAELHAELAAEGFRAEHHDAWLASFPAVRVDDMVVRTEGSLATVLERVLFAAGRGESAVALAGVLALTDRVGEVRAILQRDSRFIRVAGDVYELAEWGTAPISDVSGPGSRDGKIWLQIDVDAGTLRGDNHRLLPSVFDELIPISEAGIRTFTSRYGPVSVTDAGAGSPVISSLRHLALACGARLGDELWLGFDTGGEVAVRCERRDDMAADDHDRAALALPLFADAQGAT